MHDSTLPLRTLYYGEDKPLPQSLTLHAGPLSMMYEQGELRYVKLGRREVVRRLYIAVRDRIWRTIAPRLDNVQIAAGDDSFEITFDVSHTEAEINFYWQGRIQGDAHGTVTFSMDGVARSTFWRGRIGFCVLHPMYECAGAPTRVEQDGVGLVEREFPRFIAPHAPFVDMKSIAHEVDSGLWAELQFSGDLFEMEDQRNWTDASFKTFCTPLRLPRPVEIQAGTRVQQSVTLKLRGTVRYAEAPPPTEVTVSIDPLTHTPLPSLGLGTASHADPLTSKEMERLSRLRLSHLRLDLKLSDSNHVSALTRAAAEAERLSVELEAALFLSNHAEQELESLVATCRRLDPRVARWLVFHVDEFSTSRRWIELSRTLLRRFDDGIPLGSGTNHYFTELNRQRPPGDLLDLACYSVNPQAHAFDNASLVETLAAQAATVESARQFLDVPLAVTPVTLRPRFNPHSGEDPPVPPGELPFSVDPRQMSLFGAVWTMGSVKYLAESGVDTITCFETTGWRGVMEREMGSPLPDRFRSLPAAAFPLYHVLAAVGDFAGGRVVRSQSSDPLQIESLVLEKDHHRRILIANMTAEAKSVNVELHHPQVRWRILDETNVVSAMRTPDEFWTGPCSRGAPCAGRLALSLRPYAIVIIDHFEDDGSTC